MPSATDYPSRGQILAIRDGVAVFKPAGTNYELHLQVAPDCAPPLNTPIDVLIRCTARKVWTVPSGGAWVQPIFGSPRIIQGRLRHAGDNVLVIHAGAMFIVSLHPTETVIELPEGPMAIDRNLINVVALPGATLELLSPVQA